MFADEDVVNDALALLGDDGIGSFTDDERGRDASRIFRVELGFALGVYPFSWARKIFLLSKLAEPAPTGHAALFALPPERIGPPLRVTDDATDPDRIFNAFVLLDDRVASDAAALWAECKFLPRASSWSPTFRAAVVTALAGRYAYARAADKDVQERLLRQAYGTPDGGYRGGLIGAAIAEDARATPPRRLPMAANPLSAARWC